MQPAVISALKEEKETEKQRQKDKDREIQREVSCKYIGRPRPGADAKALM